jgi:hypothetical protein
MSRQLRAAESRFQELHPSTVAGIPCVIGVVDLYADTSDGWVGRRTTFKFKLLDRRGYPAPWLAAKLDAGDEQRFIEEIIEARRH